MLHTFKNGLLAAAMLLACAPPVAHAGEFLHFKQGTVRTSNFSAMPGWFRDSINGPEAERARYFVVQFKAKIAPADHDLLLAAGAREMRYVPDDALIVRASRTQLASVWNAASVRAIAPYNARWKMSQELAPSVFTARDQTRLLIRVFADEDAAAVTAAISALPNARVIESGGKSISAVMQTADIARLVEVEGVEWAQEAPQFTTMDARLMDGAATPPAPTEPNGDYTDLDGYESGTRVMNLEAAWGRGFNGAGQIGAMADTGLDSGDQATIFSSFKGRVKSGYAMGLFGDTWGDPMGHGTHVSGSVMGGGAGTMTGGDRIRGGAYGAQLVAESMWSPILGGLAPPSKMSDLFAKARNDGARVHTNSWGSPRSLGAYDGSAQQVDDFMYQNPDFLILFAAGNSGVDKDKDGRIDGNSIGSPATAKNCLTVGASKNLVSKFGIQKPMKELRGGADNWGVEPIASSKLSDNIEGVAAFSSRGPTADGRLKPEVVAPGTNILSNRSHVKDAEVLWGAYNADYVWSGGTSMATPLTAGAALVARQYLVDNRHIAEPSSALLKATLMHTAHDMFPGAFGAIGKEKGQELLTKRPTMDAGYGRVDMDRATALDGVQLIDEKTGVGLGEAKTYAATANKAGTLTATLVWMDPAGADAAAKALVNDLDLTVTDASGKETSLHDSLNNSEMIEMPVAAGSYQVRVKGANVPQGKNGKQAFALVISVN